MRTFVMVVLMLGILAGSAVIANAQGDGEPPQVPIHVYASQDGVHPGGHMHIAVVYDLPADYHIQVNELLYAEPVEGEPFRLGPQQLPNTVLWEGDPVLKGKVVVIYDLALGEDVPTGGRSLRIRAGYQACSERPIYACYPPEDAEILLPVAVVEPGTAPKPLHAEMFGKAPPPESANAEQPQVGTSQPIMAPPADWIPQTPGAVPGISKPEATPKASLQEGLAQKLRNALAKGSWIAFLIVFIAGFLTSFTPCVYPMIPITIGFITGASRGRFSGFVLSLFFVLGIAIVYSSLGLVAALSGGIFGSALQSTPVLVVIAAVFLAMGASMLGAFNLTIPSGFQTKLQSRRRGGWIGAVMMGGITGLVASPCVGPVLVVLLTWVAQVGRPLYGFTLLFVFAVGLGVLFIVLGSFVGALKTMPRAGAWMDTVKHYFGWIFLGLAVFYLRTVLGPNGTMIAAGILYILFATHFGAFSSLAADAGAGAHWRKGIGIVVAVLGVAAMLHGLMSHYGWRDAGLAGGAAVERTVGSTVGWRGDEAVALAEARGAGRPVLIDFTADWCAACHELDKLTWSDPTISATLGGFVALRLDMTRKNPETEAIRSRWKVSGLPTVIVLDRQGNEVDRFFGFRPPEHVLPLLQQAAQG
jgi:thiol:disulfide interchange protein DsbD